MPPVASLRPMPIPRSPLTMTADLLRFVGAGGFASVEGARVLGGVSRGGGIIDVFEIFGPDCVIVGDAA